MPNTTGFFINIWWIDSNWIIWPHTPAIFILLLLAASSKQTPSIPSPNAFPYCSIYQNAFFMPWRSNKLKKSSSHSIFFLPGLCHSKNLGSGGAWLAQSEEHMTFDFRVLSLSPTIGMEPTLKQKRKNKSWFREIHGRAGFLVSQQPLLSHASLDKVSWFLTLTNNLRREVLRSSEDRRQRRPLGAAPVSVGVWLWSDEGWDLLSLWHMSFAGRRLSEVRSQAHDEGHGLPSGSNRLYVTLLQIRFRETHCSW